MYIIKLRTDAQRLQRLPSANGLLPNCPCLFPRSPEHSALWGMRRGAHMIVKWVGHSADFIQSSQFPSERNFNMSISKISKLRFAVGKVPHSFNRPLNQQLPWIRFWGGIQKRNPCHPSQASVEERDTKESVTQGGLWVIASICWVLTKCQTLSYVLYSFSPISQGPLLCTILMYPYINGDCLRTHKPQGSFLKD